MKKIFGIGILLLLMAPLSAQIPSTLFYMPGVPQANRINPSILPGCSFYLGMPVLSPIRMQFESSPLAFEDIFTPVDGSNLRINPFHPDADPNVFLEKLDELNYISTEFSTAIFSLGYRADKSFITIDITTRFEASVNYPKGIFDLAVNGASDSNTISLGGIGADVLAFNEFALGWSREDFLIPNLDIGLRGKLLFGIGNLVTSNSTIDVTASEESWNLASEMELKAAAPGFIEFVDDYEAEGFPAGIMDGLFDPIDFLALGKSIFNLDQFGMAVDVGINYRPIPQVLLSASALDMGSINWKNTIVGRNSFEYDFIGVDVNPLTGIDTSFISQVSDSVMNSFSITAGEAYATRLNTKLIGGVSFYPIEKIGIGVLSRTDLLGNGTIAQSFTGSLNMTTGKFLNLSVSYSYMSRSLDHIGAGFSVNLGPFNVYLLSDNIVSDAWKPFEAKSLNLWYGMNLTFGWKRLKREAKNKADMPLVL